MTRNIAALIGSAMLAWAAPAAATTWNTNNNVSLTLTGGSIYCSTTTCQQTTSGLTGSIITLTAYSTPTLQTTSSTSPVDTGNWLDAKLQIWGGYGVGITNTVQSAPAEGVPQHAQDNYGVNDVLVVDFGSNNWDVSSFKVGWACTMVSAGSSCSSTTNVNIDAWVGGTSAIDFNNAAFSANGTGASILLSGNPSGFQALTLDPDSGGAYTTRTDTTTPSPLGRYLVITGNLSSYTDAFKIQAISASQQVTPPPGQVPLPGTMALLSLGLLAFGFSSRRRRIIGF